MAQIIFLFTPLYRLNPLDNVYNEKLTDDDGNVVFFASRSYIAKKLNISPNSLGKISDKLVVLAYHQLLNKLDGVEIPESLLDKSKHINAKDKKNKYKRVNYFSIPSYTYNLYKEIEEQGKQWKENHYTMKGVSREMFFRAEGKEVADLGISTLECLLSHGSWLGMYQFQLFSHPFYSSL